MQTAPLGPTSAPNDVRSRLHAQSSPPLHTVYSVQRVCNCLPATLSGGPIGCSWAPSKCPVSSPSALLLVACLAVSAFRHHTPKRGRSAAGSAVWLPSWPSSCQASGFTFSQMFPSAAKAVIKTVSQAIVREWPQLQTRQQSNHAVSVCNQRVCSPTGSR